MRAQTVSPARMSTIDPILRVDDAISPPKAQRSGNQSQRAHQLLCVGAVLALIVFGSFCVLWVQWQMDALRISLVSGDFVSFWTAGELVLEGHAADAYNEVPHFFKQVALHGDPDTWAYLAFFYPPYFLLLCAGFALLPYLAAVGLWLVTTCTAYAAALRALVPKDLRDREAVWVLFLGYPAVLVNAGFGQNGFLSTALLGGAAVWLDRRPALAGICLGCLSYKPQLGIVVPLALASGRTVALFRGGGGDGSGVGGGSDVGVRRGHLVGVLGRHVGCAAQLDGGVQSPVPALLDHGFRIRAAA